MQDTRQLKNKGECFEAVCATTGEQMSCIVCLSPQIKNQIWLRLCTFGTEMSIYAKFIEPYYFLIFNFLYWLCVSLHVCTCHSHMWRLEDFGEVGLTFLLVSVLLCDVRHAGWPGSGSHLTGEVLSYSCIFLLSVSVCGKTWVVRLV